MNNLPNSLSPQDVMAGIEAFEGKHVNHNFIDSTKFDLLHSGKRYPPKAIAALATYHQTGKLLKPSDFKGGIESKCFLLLNEAGFRIIPKSGLFPFIEGSDYTRKDIGKYIGTLQNMTSGNWATGYHLHKDSESGIEGWFFLFANVDVSGRTGNNYGNQWLSNTQFKWYGKTTSKVGQPQIEQLLSGEYPVLLFTRIDDRKPFTYQGRVSKDSVVANSPVEVIWNLPSHESKEFVQPDDNQIDLPEREKVVRAIYLRRGQQGFRQRLLEKYNYKCVISDCDIQELLEAAHIHPYASSQDNHHTNGLLLRADIHTLFDLNLIAIQPGTNEIHLHESIKKLPYSAFSDKKVAISLELNQEALALRWQQFIESSE